MSPTDLPEPAVGPPVPGQLTFQAPRRGKPPRHLADLSPAERKSAVEALGHKGFRAKQLSTHYFERLVESPDDMTDLPKAVRDDLVEVTAIEAGGHTLDELSDTEDDENDVVRGSVSGQH